MIEAMKTLVKALERADKISGHPNNAKAIKVGRQAIEQAEQAQPTAWTDEHFTQLVIHEDIAQDMGANIQLYTYPPQRKPLSDERLQKLMYDYGYEADDEVMLEMLKEAAHGIKE